MKRRKNLLFPLLTLLTVLAAALVPQRISLIQDARMTGQVHVEALTGDNNFSYWTPTLAERIDLVVRDSQDDADIARINQALSSAELRQAEDLALKQLEELGLFPDGLLPVRLSSSYGTRFYLWLPGQAGGAGFLDLTLEDTGQSIWAHVLLDEESGLPLRLNLVWPGLAEYLPSSADVGVQFLARLELDYTRLAVLDHEAFFTLSGAETLYTVSQSWDSLLIAPFEDSIPMDEMGFSIEVIQNSSENDASLMQKGGYFDADKR